MRYSKEQLSKAKGRRNEIIKEWSRPRLSDNFRGWNPKQINVIICGKSGSGKSSLINIIGKYLGKDFQSHVDIVECTEIPAKFIIHSNVVV